MAVQSGFLHHYRHGLNLFNSGHYDQALAALKQALLLEPNFPDAYVAVAKIYDELGNYAGSISLYEKIQKMLPNDQEIHKRLALAYKKTHNARRARRILKKVLRANPNDTDARCQLAKWLIEDRKFREADSLLRKGIRLTGTCPEFYYLLGEIRRLQCKLELAQEYYEQCLEIDPNHHRAKRGISRIIRALDSGNAHVAADTSSEDVAVKEELVEAAQIFTDGKYDLAIVRFRELLEKKVVRRQASILLGLAYVRKGLYKRARDLFHDLANAMHPEPLVLLNLGLCYNRMGKYDLAVRALSDAILADPEYYEALLELGSAYQGMGETKLARETYLRAIKLAVSDPRAYALIARLEYDLGHKTQASQILARGQQLDPQSPEILIAQGYISLREGDPGKALEALRECARASPHSFEAHKYLAQTYQALGDMQAAGRCFQHAYQLNPDDEECRRAAEQVQYAFQARKTVL